MQQRPACLVLYASKGVVASERLCSLTCPEIKKSFEREKTGREGGMKREGERERACGCVCTARVASGFGG